jgi:hypothetical protein
LVRAFSVKIFFRQFFFIIFIGNHPIVTIFFVTLSFLE